MLDILAEYKNDFLRVRGEKQKNGCPVILFTYIAEHLFNIYTADLNGKNLSTKKILLEL